MSGSAQPKSTHVIQRVLKKLPIFFIMSMLWRCSVAQSIPMMTDGSYNTIAENLWNFDTQHSYVVICGKTRWREVVMRDVTEMVEWEGFVRLQHSWWGESCVALATADGRIVLDAATEPIVDSLLIMAHCKRLGGKLVVLNHAADTLALVSHMYTTNLIKDSIDGSQVFCLPKYIHGDNYTLPEMKTWGMLDRAAQWLIEPKFDAPFRFQNGFAEVVYYGQKRKINEKGEFVE